MLIFYVAPSGLYLLLYLVPRALPWANLFQAFSLKMGAWMIAAMEPERLRYYSPGHRPGTTNHPFTLALKGRHKKVKLVTALSIYFSPSDRRIAGSDDNGKSTDYDRVQYNF